MPPPHHFTDDRERFGVGEFGGDIGVVREQQDLVFAWALDAFDAGVAIVQHGVDCTAAFFAGAGSDWDDGFRPVDEHHVTRPDRWLHAVT